MPAGELIERLTGAQRAYGEPFEKDGVTVITASTVYAGGGFGSGESRGEQAGGGEGGGGGVMARPIGVYVIKDGKVSWQPAIDMDRFILGSQIIAFAALLIAGRILRRRSRRRAPRRPAR
ncbi:MAG TPA: spore germination protein GerW family protein [Thermopolyspora sp.]|jgi:Uncharacterized conserved protein